jgi:signal transduction histidine kinase
VSPPAIAAPVDDLIRQVPLFAELSAEEAAELRAAARQVRAAPGEVIIREGEPGDSLYIILAGALEVTKRDGNRELTLATRREGEFLGEMSLLEQAPRTASVRAVEQSELLVIGPAAFRRLLEQRPETATSIFRTVAGRLRSTEASLVQNDRLAALGTLAAGLAHELNNPAAAIQRSTEYLREAFESWRRRTLELNELALTPAERQSLGELEQGIVQCGFSHADDPAVRREESRLIPRLEALDLEEPWEVAPTMAAYGWTVERLDTALSAFSELHAGPVLRWLAAGLAVQLLMEEIERAARAVSRIVHAVKSYAYLDQAPVQDVDLRASLEDTLMILNHKLKHGVEVVRRYDPELPRIEAYAGELNQVWTNIIDNAVQAMGGEGRLELDLRGLGEEVEVRIADTGPGIPPEVGARIFDPFFTTKPQGSGTGLGLHIARDIVVNRHRGRIDFDSRPGHTEFRIVLPVRGPAAAPEPGLSP